MVACGGSTDIWEEQSEGGSSPGGNGPGGKGGGAAGGAAGKATGGSIHSGGTISSGGSLEGGTGGVGGTIIVTGGYAGTGGGGVVDPRCPPRQPSAECSEDPTLACQYDFSGCLCYSQPSAFAFCNKVDPSCPGAASAAPPPEPDAGSGGFTAKIALPPKLTCRCSGGAWACTYGP
jgi:hypothetical protein